MRLYSTDYAPPGLNNHGSMDGCFYQYNLTYPPSRMPIESVSLAQPVLPWPK